MICKPDKKDTIFYNRLLGYHMNMILQTFALIISFQELIPRKNKNYEVIFVKVVGGKRTIVEPIKFL